MSFNQLVELETDDVTHDIPHFMESDKLDRTFVAADPSMLISTTTTAKALHRPELLHADGISDHAPLLITIGYDGKSGKPNLAIKSYIFEAPQFAYQLALFELDSSLDTLGIDQRWALHKQLIRRC